MKKLTVKAYSWLQAVFAIERYAKNGWKLNTTNEDMPKHIGSEYRLTFIPDNEELTDGFHYKHIFKLSDGNDYVSVDEPPKKTMTLKRGPGRPKQE